MNGNNAAQPEAARHVYFMPNEMTVLVYHPHDPTNSWIQTVVESLGINAPLSLAIGSPSVTTFDHSEEGRASVSTLHLRFDNAVEDPHEADLAILEAIDRINDNVVTELLITFDEEATDEQTAEAEAAADARALTKVENEFVPVVRAAAPNWLYGGAPNQADGGPGGKPVPEPNPLSGVKYESSVVNAVIDPADCNQPVVVVILDTAPPEDVWNNLPNQLSDPSNLLSNNGLLKRIHLNLRITRNIPGVILPATPPDPNSFSLAVDYEMSDHGLFVAGIIHENAPDAQLYLYEVLNTYGDGTDQTVISGLHHILSNLTQEFGSSTVIINCSLCISFDSVTSLLQYYPTWRRLAAHPKTYLQLNLFPLHRVIRDILAAAEARGIEVRILAAAGNDGLQGVAAPEARYPAAFSEVIGVGASDAWYSNKADRPPVDGIMTEGGSAIQGASARDHETDATDGLVGLYIGNFPDGTLSDNGWARWSGTSFATAIMSGIFARAAACGESVSPKSSNDFYVKLKNELASTGSASSLLVTRTFRHQ